MSAPVHVDLAVTFVAAAAEIRADMSKVTSFSPDAGGASLASRVGGGIFFDLGGHMLDQITW